MQTGLRRKKQRIMAIMLVIMLVAGMLPTTSFAGEDKQVKVEQTQKALHRESAPKADTQQNALQRESAPQTGEAGNIPQTGGTGNASPAGYVVTVKDAADASVLLEGAVVEYEVMKVSGNKISKVVEKTTATTVSGGKAVLTGLQGKESIINDNDSNVKFYLRLKVTKDGYYEFCNYDDTKNGDTITKATGETSVSLTGAYVVTVTDKTGGNALDGAIVTYNVVKTETGSSYSPEIASGRAEIKNGKAVLTALADKKGEIDDKVNAQTTFTLKMTLEAAGYYNEEKDESITSISGSSTVQMTPVYAVVVKEKEVPNKLLSGATVTYKVTMSVTGADGFPSTETIEGSTETDENGKAVLTALADKKSQIDAQTTLEMTVKAAGYYSETINESMNSATGTREVEMTPVYAVTVKDGDDSSLLSDATVKYEVVQAAAGDDSAEPDVRVSGTATTKDGKAVLTALADIKSVIKGQTGFYLKLTVTKEGYAEACNYDDTNKNGEAIADINSLIGTKEIQLEKAYTVSVVINGNGNGTVTTNPELNGGKVTVKKSEGNTFKIAATPDEGFRLTKFEKRVGNEGTVLSEPTENNAKFEEQIVEITADTTFTATFEPNGYDVIFQKTGNDKCKVTMNITNWWGQTRSYEDAGKYTVYHGEKISFSVSPSVDYKFDNIIKESQGTTAEIPCTPDGIDVYKSNAISCTGGMTLKVNFSEITAIPAEDNPLEKTDYYSITFTKDSQNTEEDQPIEPVIRTAEGKKIYVLPEDTLVTLAPDGTNYNYVKYKGDDKYALKKSNIEKVDDKEVKTNMQMDNIYLFSFDTKDKCTIDCNMEFVIDDKAPKAVIGLPDAAAVENGVKCYNKDVTFDVNVTEQEVGKCSGIASVKYWIVSNGKTTAEKTLYEYKPGDEILDTFKGSVKIDAAANNYDGVEIYVEVTDRMGNSNSNKEGQEPKPEPTIINIDATAPQVSLTYDNNNSYQNSQYFNAARTATIVVKEREDNFDYAKATAGIAITARDANNRDVMGAYTISEWHTQKNQADDNLTTHTATIAFSADANYTLAMGFQDIAGNSNAPIDTGDSLAPYAFTVDTKAPTGTVTAKSKEGRNSTWENLVTDLKFGYYSKAKITLSGTTADETSPVGVQYYKQVQTGGDAVLKALSASDLDRITDWKRFEGFSVAEDEKFVVYLKITDSAGNYTYISTDGLIVDEHAPVKEVFEPKVTIEPEQPVNGYYNKDVTVKLKVEDPEVNGTYTGLKEISYKVYNKSVSETEATQEEKLLSFAVKNPAQSDLVQNWEGKIKVDSSKNNSNDIVVEVYAEDNAGNSATYTKKLKIDTTAPAVNIKYSNNSAVSERYFNAGRTATIEVTERNFDISDMQIKITNADGAAPKVSDWKRTKGTGNGDDTKWTATVNYAQDGEYTFDIAYKDRAGNKSVINYAAGTVAAGRFTVDGTKPVISVSYDNNNVHNGEYYNTARRATVSITEHNFDPGRVETVISAAQNGAAVAAPTISGWTANGDVHTATISYANDARYTFDISVTDMAGNAAADFAEQSFYVDQTVPELEITGVKDQSANAGDVIPVITYSDANFDADALHIELTGANRKEVKPEGSYSNGSTGGSFTFNNFAKTQDVDDIYVLSATLTDRAGNTVSEEVTFSVNRFGSTYDFSDRTEQINGSYIQASEDIVVVETNPTKLTDIKVTLFQNNETLQLAEGKDYDIRQTGGNGQWYYYTYTVYKDVFQEDGIYKLVLHSKDGAENISENILETKDAEISFGVDKTKPNIVVANLESKQTYALDNMTVIMSASDNLKLTEVMVYLDESLHAEWKDASLETMLDQSGDLTFDIPGTSNHAHKVKIVCRDAAGNEASQEITGFYVTTNLWVRYFNNKPLFYGSILAMVSALGLIVFIVVKKRKKEEA